MGVNTIKLLQSLSIDNTNDITQIGSIISHIWRKYNKFENILSHSYAYQNEFNFNDNIEYFMDNISRIMSDEIHEQKESILNEEDMIKYQTQSFTISEHEYNCNDNEFK